MAISDLLSSDPVSKYREKINAILAVANVAVTYSSGTFASRPAANAVPAGRHYFSTDTGDMSVSNGTTWFTLTPQNRANFRVKKSTWPTQTINAATTAKITNFDEENFDLGNCFDISSTNDRFTAPVKGIYRFELMIQSGDESGFEYLQPLIYVNGSPLSVGYWAMEDYEVPETLAEDYGAAIYESIQLEAGDTVEMHVKNATTSGGGSSNTVGNAVFAGMLLAQIP